jgi:non-ribosomal peptide synthetase component E (peptide arylation enzyme)
MDFQTILTGETARRYKRDGWWNDRTLLEYFDASVAATPAATAIVAPRGRRMTFAELDDESRRVASHFAALGIRKGDVISVQLPNRAEFASVHLAATRLGAVTNPLLPIYRENELSYILGFARSAIAIIPGIYRNWDYPAMYAGMWPSLPDLKQIFVVDGEGRGRMRPYSDLCRVAVGPIPEGRFGGDDVSALIFTSGTESKPKGVMHSHNTMMYATLVMARLLGLTRDDVVWTPSPLGHGTGFLWGLRQALTLGGKLVLQDIWDPEEALHLIEAEGCSYTLAATPFASMLVNSRSAGRRDTSSFRYFACAGAPIPRQLGTDTREKLGCLLIGMWGMTECFVGSASSPQNPEDKIWGTDGKAMPGAELAIFDESRTRMLSPGESGELATRGPHVALGYFNDPERTTNTFSPDGWLFTNDLATMDAEGYVRIVGRKKDIINRGGLKISAREMEDFLQQHPLVNAAAIVAVPDARLGEKSCVFVIPKAPRAPTLPELIGFLEERGIAKYKLPEYLVVVESFPMTPSGKIQKFMLRDGVANGLYAAHSS